MFITSCFLFILKATVLLKTEQNLGLESRRGMLRLFPSSAEKIIDGCPVPQFFGCNCFTYIVL